MYQWAGAPAGGGVEGRDGFHLIGHLITLGGLTLPNLETYEQLYPVRFRRQELRCDSAGPGLGVKCNCSGFNLDIIWKNCLIQKASN